MTLIAVMAVARFVFGLFGPFTSTARVEVSYAPGITVADTISLTLRSHGNRDANARTTCSAAFGEITTGGTVTELLAPVHG